MAEDRPTPKRRMPPDVALNLSATALTILATVVFVGAVVGGIVPTPAPFPAAGTEALGGAGAAEAPLAETEAVVRRFYEAANASIRSGDASGLRGVLASDVVVHAALPAATSERAGLAAYLAAVHAVWPDATLAIDELSTVGDQAMARVAVRDGAGTFLGLDFEDGPPIWGRRDAFRVANGRVVELWSDLASTVLLEPLGRVKVEVPDPLARELVLERVRLRPGQPWSPETASTPRAMVVAEGRVTLAVDRGRAATDVASVIEAGQTVALPQTGTYRVRADPASAAPLVLVVALPYVDHSGPYRPFIVSPTAEQAPALSDDPGQGSGRIGLAAPPDATVERLASGPVPDAVDGPVDVSFGQVTLEPGGTFRFPASDGAMVLGIGSGRCLIVADGDPMVWHRSDRGAGGRGLVGRLGAGDGALVPPRTGVTLHNSGGEPVVVLAANVQSSKSLRAEDP